jgi:hypothetical protein
MDLRLAVAKYELSFRRLRYLRVQLTLRAMDLPLAVAKYELKLAPNA